DQSGEAIVHGGAAVADQAEQAVRRFTVGPPGTPERRAAHRGAVPLSDRRIGADMAYTPLLAIIGGTGTLGRGLAARALRHGIRVCIGSARRIARKPWRRSCAAR